MAIRIRTTKYEVEKWKSRKWKSRKWKSRKVSLNAQVAADLTAAMKAKDAARLSALRMLKAAVMNK